MAYSGFPVTLGSTNTRLAAILNEYVARTAFDNISSKHFFTAWLKAKALKPMPGGKGFTVPIAIANSTNFAFVAQMAELPAAMDDPIRTATFDSTTLAGMVTVSQEDLADNAGNLGGIMDVMAEAIAAGERAMAEVMSTKVCTGGASAVADELDGISHLIRFDPTNTVGGVDRSSVTQYQNKHEGVADLPTQLALGLPELVKLVRACSDGDSSPDLLLCDEDTWDHMAAHAVTQQSLTTIDAVAANLGFRTISWQGLPLAWDSHVNPEAGAGGYQGNVDVGTIFVLSSDALKLCVNRNLVHSGGMGAGDFKELPLQLAVSAKMTWRGALALTNGKGTGILGINAF